MANIYEILKDCPSGTRLYSPMCGKCSLIGVNEITKHIYVFIPHHDPYTFFGDGTFVMNEGAECMLFPSKENRDWNSFSQSKFKKGDFVINGDWVCLYYGKNEYNALQYLACCHLCENFNCIHIMGKKLKKALYKKINIVLYFQESKNKKRSFPR